MRPCRWPADELHPTCLAVLAQTARHYAPAAGVMSHHMHAMTASDLVLTVLPFFHAGGLDLRSIRHK